MSGHSSRWSYQMGPLSEPHLQQAPLTPAATSPVATRGPGARSRWEEEIEGARGGTGGYKEAGRGGAGGGTSWACLIGVGWLPLKLHEYKAPRWGPDLHSHDSVITPRVPVMSRWLGGPAHAFTRMPRTAAPPHQWTQPDTPLSRLIRRL